MLLPPHIDVFPLLWLSDFNRAYLQAAHVLDFLQRDPIREQRPKLVEALTLMSFNVLKWVRSCLRGSPGGREEGKRLPWWHILHMSRPGRLSMSAGHSRSSYCTPLHWGGCISFFFFLSGGGVEPRRERKGAGSLCEGNPLRKNICTQRRAIIGKRKQM